MKTKVKKWDLSTVLMSVAAVLLIISIAVTLTLQIRGIYYFDIDYLDIPAMSGFSREMIKENYNVLIDYNSVFFRGRLVFPSLPMSETGEIHFEEVKNIFSAIQIMGLILAVPVIAAAIWKIKKKQYFFLKLSAIFAVILPAAIGLFVAINWDAFFVMFHKLFFNNDYWVFDYSTDPVILILPDQFFMHCAVIILLIIVLFAVLLLTAHRILTKGKKASVQ